MNDVSGHNSTLLGYTVSGTTWANEMNLVMNHDPGAGSIARPVDPQSTTVIENINISRQFAYTETVS